MAIRAPVNECGLTISTTNFGLVTGATVTPGNNLYGTYVQLLAGAAVTDDAYGFWVNVNSLAVSGAARDAIAKIGLDPAGGTTYTDFITDLYVSCAGAHTGVGVGGIWYYFPVRIKAGTSIAIALSVNNATVGTAGAQCQLLCRPSHPDLIRVGSYVRTFGSTPGTSSGTAFAPVSGSKSAYVQLGSAIAAADSLWYWHLGVGINQSVVGNNNPLACDLAIGSSTTVNRIVVADQIILPTTAEVIGYRVTGAAAIAKPGDLVFMRAATTGVLFTGWSAIGYGIGG